MQARKHIFPLTPESKRKGWLPLSDPVWMEWGCPWWIFSSDRPTKGEAQVFGWRALSPQSLDQSLKDLELEEEDVVRKIWMSKMGGNEVLGKHNFQESDSGRSNLRGVKPADFIKGGTYRSIGTHGAPCTGSGSLQESLEGVGMEVSEQDGSSESA